MAIMRWKPLHHHLDDLFNEFPTSIPHIHTDLSCDVHEDNNNVYVEMHVPGITAEQIDIKAEETHLHITASRQVESESADKHSYHKEIRRGSFERIIQLPAPVLGDQAQAEVTNGVLKIVLPKKQKSHGKHTVKITQK